MYFALICTDKPDSLALRKETRPAHLDYLNGINAEGKLKMAGPLLDDAGDPKGSLLVLEAADMDEARALAAGDPYAKAGLFASTELSPFNWSFNAPGA